MRRLTVFFLAAVAVPATAAGGATCGDWIPQTNGTSWRYCSDAQTGERYCELKRGTAVRRMTCP